MSARNTGGRGGDQSPVVQDDTPMRARKACAFCRGRRIKCQVNPGATSCNACLTRNRTCILEKDTPNGTGEQEITGDLNELGPLALLRQNFLRGPTTAAQLSHNVEKMSAELKVYKDMAAYYQSQMSRLAQGLGPDPSKPAPANVKQEILSFLRTMDSGKNSPTSSSSKSSGSSKGSPTSPQSPIDNIIQRNPATGHFVATPELIQHCHRAYLESLSVVAHGECVVPISAVGIEKKFEMLIKPMEFRDKRAPEDADELSAHVTIVVDSETSLDTLIDLWEYAVVFEGGCHAMGSSAAELTHIFADNSEKLMRVVIFQREGHTVERHAERLVRALTGMSVQYRHANKLGAASSALMIAHQIIATFPAVIPPILSDRIYVLLLLGASTEHERREWLHMLHDQIHFTTTTLLCFNIGFIVSKLRTHPIITPTVLSELSARLQELENLATTVPGDVALFHVWLKILISCFHGELGARCGDIPRATAALGRIETLVRENYTRALAVILLMELKNFALHCSPCSVLIDGKEQVLAKYVIERVELIHSEMSNEALSTNHWSPAIAAGDQISILMSPEATGASPNPAGQTAPFNDASSSSSATETNGADTKRSEHTDHREQEAFDVGHNTATNGAANGMPSFLPGAAVAAAFGYHAPYMNMMNGDGQENLPFNRENGGHEILTSWSQAGNRLGTELFGSGTWFPSEDDPDLELI